jgi:MFS family permease
MFATAAACCLVTQSWMAVMAAVLGALTLIHAVTPWTLLLLTFLLGLGAAINDPAWQAITPEIVPPEQLAPAVALNSSGYNLARAVGPALGGAIMALAGPGIAFVLNALSFSGLLVYLYRWDRSTAQVSAPPGRFWRALMEGVRYLHGSPAVRALLIRTWRVRRLAPRMWTCNGSWPHLVKRGCVEVSCHVFLSTKGSGKPRYD